MKSLWGKLQPTINRVRMVVSQQPALHTVAEIVVPLALFAAVLFMLYRPALSSSFGVQDEWRIAWFHYEILSAHTPGIVTFANLTLGLIQFDITTGLFRPVYDAILALEVTAFGENLFLFHMTSLLAGVAVCFLTFRAARTIGAVYVAALLMGLWLVVTGNEGAAMWTQLGPTGWTGMTFLAIALWAVTRAAKTPTAGPWDAVTIVALFLAGWTKESYIIVSPAIMVLRLALHKMRHRESWRESVLTLRAPLGIAAGIFFLQALPVPMLARQNTYGAHFVNPDTTVASIDTWPGRLWEIGLIAAYYVPLVAGMVAIDTVDRDSAWRQVFLAGLVIGALWIAPQIVLFKARLFERYAYPALIAIAGLNALGLSLVWSRRLWVATLLCVIVSAGGLSASYAQGAQAASRYHATSIALDRVQTCLVDRTGQDTAVVIAFDGTTLYPGIFLINGRFRSGGMQTPIYLSATVDETPKEPIEQLLADDLGGRSFDGHFSADGLTARQVGAIVLLEPRSAFVTAAPAWYDDGQWVVQKFTEPVYDIPLLGEPSQIDQVRFNVLVPVKAGQTGTGYRQICSSADAS